MQPRVIEEARADKEVRGGAEHRYRPGVGQNLGLAVAQMDRVTEQEDGQGVTG